MDHFLILLACSLFLTVKIYRYKNLNSIIPLLLIKFFILFLIGYPLGSYIGLELFLFISIALETSLLVFSPLNIVLLIIFNILFIIIQGPGTAWGYEISDITQHDEIFTISFSIIISILISTMTYNMKIREEKNKDIEKLESAITQLSNANIGFQEYVKAKELEAIGKERKRVSREIHDGVGYTLTNIIMLMEASYLLGEKDPDKQKKSILEAKKQAVNGLEETRFALRSLRSEELHLQRGLNAINELIVSFKNATGMDIKTEYGNFPAFTNDEIDIILFRMIQEGMTNAIRHGRATQIRILFRHEVDTIYVKIHDNGIGSKSDISKGIGLTGMQERLTRVNGTLNFKNVIDGFELTAEIPWKESDNEATYG